MAEITGFQPNRGAAPAPAGDWWRESFGAIDLGTNNCRLLIARPTARGFKVIDAFSRIVRLGEGLFASGALSEAAMGRTIEALIICARKLRRRRVTRVRAVATEACRRADNCAEFLARVRAATGIELEIISSEEEAGLALAGCTSLLDRQVPNAVIFDIGGGSTQVSWLEVGEGEAGGPWPGRPRSRLLDCYSVPIGVVTLAEGYGGEEIAAATYDAMTAEVKAALAPFEAQHGLSSLAASGGMQMLGTSGTVTTLTGVHKRLPRYDRSRVDGAHLRFDTIAKLSRRIAGMSFQERLNHPCIGVERADLVVAGCAILGAITETWPVGRLRVADRGLREGILYQLMHGNAEDSTEPEAERPGTGGAGNGATRNGAAGDGAEGNGVAE